MTFFFVNSLIKSYFYIIRLHTIMRYKFLKILRQINDPCIF